MAKVDFVSDLPAGRQLSVASLQPKRITDVKVREDGRTAVRPYSPIDSVFDMDMKRVTIWKNIL